MSLTPKLTTASTYGPASSARPDHYAPMEMSPDKKPTEFVPW
jgi:hypothetical protein